MQIKDIITEIKNKDYTDDNRLWFEGIEFTLFNPDTTVAKNCFFEDNEKNDFEYSDLEVEDYHYSLDAEYLNFVIIKCRVLLKNKLE